MVPVKEKRAFFSNNSVTRRALCAIIRDHAMADWIAGKDRREKRYFLLRFSAWFCGPHDAPRTKSMRLETYAALDAPPPRAAEAEFTSARRIGAD